MKGYHSPSPTLHHPSPSSFYERAPFIGNGSVIIDDQLQPSLMTNSRLQWWPGFEIRWRVGEGWWRVAVTLHLSQPQCLSGFQAKRWRVKGKIESRIFLTQKQLRKLLPNRSHSPIEIYLPTHYFMPGNGTILPQLRATLCHYQAKSGISLLSHLNRAHSLMLHTLQTEWKNWF